MYRKTQKVSSLSQKDMKIEKKKTNPEEMLGVQIHPSI